MSNTPFFDYYCKFKKEHPEATERDLYYACIEQLDGICYHPVSLRETLFMGKMVNIEKTFGKTKYHGIWVCPVCDEGFTDETYKPVNILERRHKLLATVLRVATEET